MSEPISAMAATGYSPRYIDIGINLADPTKPHAEDGHVDLAKSAKIMTDLRTLIETAAPENADRKSVV